MRPSTEEQPADAWSAGLLEHMNGLRNPMPAGTIILGFYNSRLSSFVTICRSNQGRNRMRAITRKTKAELEKMLREDTSRYDCDIEITLVYVDTRIDLLHTALRGVIAAAPLLAWAVWAGTAGRHGLPGSSATDLLAALTLGALWSAVKIWEWQESAERAYTEMKSAIGKFQPGTPSPDVGMTHVMPAEGNPTMMIRTDPAPPQHPQDG